MDAELLSVDKERRAGCAIDRIVDSKRVFERKTRRPAALSAREALVVLEFEAHFVAITAGSIASGFEITEDDRDRLRLAYDRIFTIVNEVNR